MALPLILISGPAGSGKDTVAAFIAKNFNGICIAQADPMKRLVRKTFGFTEEQLWGPSEMRNAIDTRFTDANVRAEVRYKLDAYSYEYVSEVLPHLGPTACSLAAEKLVQWGDWMLREAVGGISPRKVLQTLGTEWGRQFSRDMWIDYAKRAALKLLGGGYSYGRTFGLMADNGACPDWVIITDGRFRNELVGVLALGGRTWRISTPGVDGSAAERAGVMGHASETEQRSIPSHFFTCHYVNDKSRGLAFCENETIAYMRAEVRASTTIK